MVWFYAAAVALWLLMCIGIFAAAWWVSEINCTLTRLLILTNDQHFERRKVATDERGRRAMRHKQFALWLAETASDLKRLCGIAERLEEQHRPEEQRKTLEMDVALPSTDAAGAKETPPTVRALKARGSEAAPAPSTGSQGDRPRDSDAETQCWTGPVSRNTVVGIGASHGPTSSAPAVGLIGK
jgi:hypothetical protein